jgi:ABC-2 type transport system permease protein
MDTPIQALALLFPIRHYYMIYQICVLNGFPWTDALLHFGALALFILLPLFFVGNIRKALLEYEYMP